MTEVQKRLLEMFKCYHTLCSSHNLRYYAVAGTALGAVRHRGFIPWDDDMDFGMPRSDYEKFKKIAQTEINGVTPFIAEFPSAKKDFVYMYGKLYDTRTTLIENTRYKTKRGIFIDIFPLDGLEHTYPKAIKEFKKINRLNNLYFTRICAVRNGRNWYKNTAIVLSQMIPDRVLDHRKLSKKIDKKCEKHDFDSCEYVTLSHGNWGVREIMPRSYFGKPVLKFFEGEEIYIPERYEEYLKSLYGNWRKFPPKEKRVTHHDYLLLDLNKSYLDKER